MDDKDRRILRILENDGRASFTDIGARVSLSANAVADRVRRLTRRGIIKRFTAEIESAAFGLSLRALIEAKMESGTSADQFEDRVSKIEGVIRAFVTTGKYDWVLEVVARNQADLQRIVEALRAGGLLRESYTRIIGTDRRYPVTRDAEPA